MAGAKGKRRALVQKLKTILGLSSRASRRKQPEGCPEPRPIFKSLETLPAELRCQILASLATLDDLKSAMRASPVLYQQYRADRKTVLDAVLRRILGDQTFVDAYTVQRSAGPPCLAVEVLTDEYRTHRATPSLLSRKCAVADLVGMAAFYSSTIRPLLRRVFATMPARVVQHGPLSDTEHARMLRALYRFQLWCNLYGTGEGAATRGRAVRPCDMLLHFFGAFEPWEVEEISCVHEFFMDMYLQTFTWDADGRNIRFVDLTGVERTIAVRDPFEDDDGKWSSFFSLLSSLRTQSRSANVHHQCWWRYQSPNGGCETALSPAAWNCISTSCGGALGTSKPRG